MPFSTAMLTQLSYLVAAALFILGLKRMSSPLTAVSGVRWAGVGMLLATVATFAFVSGASQINLILMLAAIAVGGIIAQHAAVAIIGSAAESQFQTALAGRDVIGQAKGILMHRDDLTGLQAFALLTRVSQETNTKLLDVAKFLVTEQESRARRRDKSG